MANRNQTSPDEPEAPLPDDVVMLLRAQGITSLGEVELRKQLERHAPSYSLVRLNPIATRKWKARYRIMLAADYFDCQSVVEAYARALLASLPPVADAHSPLPPTDA